MTRKTTPVKPQPDDDATSHEPVALPPPRRRVTKAVAPALPEPPAVPVKAAAPGPRPGPKRLVGAPAASPGEVVHRVPPVHVPAAGEAGPRPAPSGVRAARAVVRPLTSIAPTAPAGLAPLATPSLARVHLAGALPPARIPPEALVAPRTDRLLMWAAGLSVAIHAVVLAIHFAPPDFKRLFDRGPPLEIALVNAKTKDKPQKAEILAQANLDGGGNTDANRRAKTPLPVLPKDSPREDIALATERVQTLERQTQELLTQLRSAPALPVQPRPARLGRGPRRAAFAPRVRSCGR